MIEVIFGISIAFNVVLIYALIAVKILRKELTKTKKELKEYKRLNRELAREVYHTFVTSIIDV